MAHVTKTQAMLEHLQAAVDAMAAQLAKTSGTVQQHLDSPAPATSEQGTSEVET